MKTGSGDRIVAITGIGVLACCGIGKEAFWAGLNGPAPACQVVHPGFLNLAADKDPYRRRLLDIDDVTRLQAQVCGRILVHINARQIQGQGQIRQPEHGAAGHFRPDNKTSGIRQRFRDPPPFYPIERLRHLHRAADKDPLRPRPEHLDRDVRADQLFAQSLHHQATPPGWSPPGVAMSRSAAAPKRP